MIDVVVVDHHDSYTWNLVHLIASVTGVLPTVVQHDEVTADAVLAHSHVVLSPGPGHPSDPVDFAVGGEVLLRATRPVLGVCLGMQGLVTAYGGEVGRVLPAHGEVASVEHDGRGVFVGIPSPLSGRALPLARGARRACRARGDGHGRRRGDGSAPPVAAAGGRPVPPRVDPLRARRPSRRQLPGAPHERPGLRLPLDRRVPPAVLLARRWRCARVVRASFAGRLARARRRLVDLRRRYPAGDSATSQGAPR